jgi:hypothetical protein
MSEWNEVDWSEGREEEDSLNSELCVLLLDNQTLHLILIKDLAYTLLWAT